MKTIVISGSARAESNTRKAIAALCPFPDYELIDLLEYKIEHYHYASAKADQDDFYAIATKMRMADHIVFATPVYWYSMSGRLKVFFDRLTDLLYAHKEIGKALHGKKTYLIACGTDPALPPGFDVPFRMTSEYFGMIFAKSLYQVVKPK